MLMIASCFNAVNAQLLRVLLWGEESNTHPSKTYLVTEGKQWAVCRHSFREEFWTETYRLQGDTIINGKTYKIEHAARHIFPTFVSSWGTVNLCAAVHQDGAPCRYIGYTNMSYGAEGYYCRVDNCHAYLERLTQIVLKELL